jgi:hypothetical protein
MQLRCTRSSSFPYEGIYASCCHWRSRADILALTTRSRKAWRQGAEWSNCVYPQAPANSALLSTSLSTGLERILRDLVVRCCSELEFGTAYIGVAK